MERYSPQEDYEQGRLEASKSKIPLCRTIALVFLTASTVVLSIALIASGKGRDLADSPTSGHSHTATGSGTGENPSFTCPGPRPCISLDDVTEGRLSAPRHRLHWHSPDTGYVILPNNTLIMYSFETVRTGEGTEDRRRELWRVDWRDIAESWPKIKDTSTSPVLVQREDSEWTHDAAVDPSGEYLLIRTGRISLYRHSVLATYFYIARSGPRSVNGKLQPHPLLGRDSLAGVGSPLLSADQDMRCRAYKWGPTTGDGSNSSSSSGTARLGLTTYDNGFLVVCLLSASDTICTAVQAQRRPGRTHLTGAHSWVYEEEVFSRADAMWWSPDGQHLAFVDYMLPSSAVSVVPYYSMNGRIRLGYPNDIAPRTHNGDYVYTQHSYVHYPKVNSSNDEVVIAVVKVPNSFKGVMVLPWLNYDSDEYRNTRAIFTDLQWMSNTQLLVQYAPDRGSTSTIITTATITQTPGPLVWQEIWRASANNAWIEPTRVHVVQGARTVMVVVMNNVHGIQLLSYHSTMLALKVIGVTDVQKQQATEILGVRAGTGDVEAEVIFLGSGYLTTSNQVQPAEQILWIARFFQTTGTTLPPVTVHPLSTIDPTRVSVWDSATVSPGLKYLALRPASGRCDVRSVQVSPEGVALGSGVVGTTGYDDVFAAWTGYNQAVQSVELPRMKFITIPGYPVDGKPFRYSCRLLFPPGFSESKRYPVLIKVYGGPNSQTATYTESYGFDAYVASFLGIIVASIDGRGTGGTYASFAHAVYNHLGEFESADQIRGAKYLATLPYVIPDRIAIWGWSYGGYMTLRTLLDDKVGNTFRAGVAVAPVTDWHFYDSIYTERYMNPMTANYTASSLLGRAGNLHTPLLLMHGSGDDNVLLQNTMNLLSKFIENDRFIDFMIYPDSRHSINKGNARKYLYQKLINFLQRHLLE